MAFEFSGIEINCRGKNLSRSQFLNTAIKKAQTTVIAYGTNIAMLTMHLTINNNDKEKVPRFSIVG